MLDVGAGLSLCPAGPAAALPAPFPEPSAPASTLWASLVASDFFLAVASTSKSGGDAEVRGGLNRWVMTAWGTEGLGHHSRCVKGELIRPRPADMQEP